MTFVNKTSKKAEEVVAEIEKAIQKDTGVILEFEYESPEALRQAVRMRINGRGWKARIKLAVDEAKLVVKVSEISYTSKLEDMVRKLAMHVDDERLYDDALLLVGRI